MLSVASREILQKTTYDNDGNVASLVIMKMKAISEGHYFKCENCRNIKTFCEDHKVQITKEEALTIFGS